RQGDVSVYTVTFAKSEVQRINISGNPTGGTFQLTVGVPNADFSVFTSTSTADISYNPTPPFDMTALAARIQTALEAVLGVGNISVTANSTSQYEVTFKGTLAGHDLPEMFITPTKNLLTPSTNNPMVVVTTFNDGGGAL